MEIIVVTGIIYAALAALAGFGMSRLKCPKWVAPVVGAVTGAGVIGIVSEIQSREPWYINGSDLLGLLFGGTFCAASIVAYFVRESRPFSRD